MGPIPASLSIPAAGWLGCFPEEVFLSCRRKNRQELSIVLCKLVHAWDALGAAAIGQILTYSVFSGARDLTLSMMTPVLGPDVEQPRTLNDYRATVG